MLSRKTEGTPEETLAKIRAQVRVIEGKTRKCNEHIEMLLTEARVKDKEGNRVGALAALKRKNQYQAQLVPLGNMLVNLEQRAYMIETAMLNKDVIAVMAESASVMKKQSVSLDDAEDVMEDAREMEELSREVSELLSYQDPGDASELERELEEIQALPAAEPVYVPASEEYVSPPVLAPKKTPTAPKKTRKELETLSLF